MLKQLITVGKTLDRSEQKIINGGFTPPFIGSSCYLTQRRCNDAMISAISFGADPAQTRCVACTTESGNPGFEVRIFGTL